MRRDQITVEPEFLVVHYLTLEANDEGWGIGLHLEYCAAGDLAHDGRMHLRLGPARALMVALALAGCGRSENAVALVDARNLGALSAWRAAAANRHSAADWSEFDAALQEIRLRAMTREGVTGSQRIAAALCDEIHGLAFADVVRKGHEAKLERLELLRADLKRMVDANALIVPQRDGGVSEAALNRRREEQQQRLEKLIAEMDAARRRIAELGGTIAPIVDIRTTQAKPAALDREMAMYEIETMIRKRRAAAIVRYGAWSVKVDQTGGALSGSERAEFEQRRKAAADQGRTVIAVQIQDRWRIFDQLVEMPAFSKAVAANLTAADRRAIADKWTELEAELWARKLAAEESTPSG